MKKNSTKGYVILGILFVLVSIIAFAVPTTKTTTFWIAYVFTVIAIGSQIVVWKFALGKGEILKSKFLGFSVISLSMLYLVVQTIVFAIFMLNPILPVWSAIIVCTSIAGIAAICIISIDIGRSEIERVDGKTEKKVFYVKALQADIELLADNETNTDIKTALVQLAEKIRFSDPMSHEQLVDIETQIEAKISDLKTATNKVETITEIILLLDERNKKCKILK